MPAVKARALLILVTATAAIAACDSDTAMRRQSAPLAQPPVGADAAAAVELGPNSAAFGARRPAAGGIAGSAEKLEAATPAPAPSVAATEQTSANTSMPTQEVVAGSMLVRVGQASVQVDSLEVGIARVRDVARRTSAVIANTSMEGGRDQTRAASLELRIPSEHFDEAVNGLAPIGRLESVNVSVQDVGEEYVDVQARLANARRLEQRLIELLANRTGKLSDVLTVERELARVREEIERYEGRMRYLRTRASVSTLTVAVHEPYPIVADRPGARPMRDAFVQAWRNLVGFTAGFIALLGVLVPLGAIVGAAYFIGRRFVPARVFRLTESKTPGTSRA